MYENKSQLWNVILNPVAGKTKAAKLWNKLYPLLHKSNVPYTEHVSAFAQHAVELAKTTADNGAKKFLIIGGDGTAHEVINGIFASSAKTESITVAMISAGAGNDWVRSIGKHTSLQTIAESMLAMNVFSHDVGVIEYMHNQQKKQKYFINIAGFGFEGMVVKKMLGKKNLLSGTNLQYWGAILRSLLFCKPAHIRLVVDGKETVLKTLSGAAGICKYNGGGLKQLPSAEFNDGLLDMTVIGNMSKLKMVLSLPKLKDGSLVKMNEIKTFRGKEIEIQCDDEIYAEADGEFLGTLPVKLSIFPQALQVLRWL